MIEQLTIENFACFKHVDVPLKPLTVLIGPNNTGKSSFLRCIHALLTQGIHDVPIDNVRNRDNRNLVSVTASSTSGSIFLESQRKQETRASMLAGLQAAFFELQAGGLPSVSAGFPESDGIQPDLASDGGNVPAVLDHYLRRDRNRFARVEDIAENLVEGFRQLSLGTPTPGERRIELLLDQVWLPTSRVSTGIQYLLFYATLAIDPRRPHYVLIEEPENGFHPRRLKDVMALLKGMTKGAFETQPSQIILTTHSPYLLDFINLDEDEVLVFSRNDDGSRTAQPVNRERLKHFTKEFLLGEIWYNESEEGLVKQSP